jgi:predicted enzyme related to lactoylglutathione lyase
MTSRNIVHIEFSSRDPKESAAFYQALFGWKMETDEQMNYTQWDPGIPPGGGFNPLGEQASAGDVLVYVSSDDIDADLKKATELGAMVLVPKTAIGEIGWFGIFKDPTGNQVGLYTSARPSQTQ